MAQDDRCGRISAARPCAGRLHGRRGVLRHSGRSERPAGRGSRPGPRPGSHPGSAAAAVVRHLRGPGWGILRLAFFGVLDADGLAISQGALSSVLAGGNPYTHGYAVSIPPGAPFVYGPLRSSRPSLAPGWSCWRRRHDGADGEGAGVGRARALRDGAARDDDDDVRHQRRPAGPADRGRTAGPAVAAVGRGRPGGPRRRHQALCLRLVPGDRRSGRSARARRARRGHGRRLGRRSSCWGIGPYLNAVELAREFHFIPRTR